MRTLAITSLFLSLAAAIWLLSVSTPGIGTLEAVSPAVPGVPAVPEVREARPEKPKTSSPAEAKAPVPLTSGEVSSLVASAKQTAVGRVFRGRVLDSRGFAVPGARVRLTQPHGAQAEVASGVDGEYVIAFALAQRPSQLWNSGQSWEDLRPRTRRAVLRAYKRVEKDPRKYRQFVKRLRAEGIQLGTSKSSKEVIARADLEGYQSDVQRIEVVSWEEGTTNIDFVLTPGSMVGGSVMKDGVGVSGADVYLLSTEFEKVDATRTNMSGSYEFGIGDVGPYHVLARRDDVGAGLIENQDPSSLFQTKLVDIELEGTGQLSGSLHYPNGKPVEHALIRIVPEAFAYDRSPEVPEDARMRLEAQGGIATSGFRTLDDGSFEFHGLLEGSFGLRIYPDPNPKNPMIALHSTGEAGIRIEYEGFRLRVRAESFTGYEIPGINLKAARLEEEDDELRAYAVSALGVGGEPLDTFFPVEAGERYMVSACAPDLLPARRTVHIGGTSFETRVSLGLSPREIVDAENPDSSRPTGRLRVGVLGAKHAAQRFDATVKGSQGTLTAFDGVALPKSREIRGLPVDSYKLTISPHDVFGHYLLPTTLEKKAHVFEGKVTVVEVEPKTGGRIAVTLLPPTRRDADEDREQLATYPAVEVELTSGKTRHTPLFRHLKAKAGELPPAAGAPVAGTIELEPGAGHWLSDVVPDGAYELELKSGAYEAEKRTFSVRKGEITTLVIRPARAE